MASSNLFAAGASLPPGYRQSDDSGRVGPDFAIIDALTADSVVARFDTSSRAGADELQFILYAGDVVSLRNLLPFISGLGLEALDEQTMSMVRPDGFECHVYQFNLCAGPAVAEAVAQWDGQTAERASATFAAVWAGLSENDGFNALTLAAQLSWRQVAVLRSYGRYLRQSSLPYSQTTIERVLLEDPVAARAVVALFDARFGDPDRGADDPARAEDVTRALATLEARIEDTGSLDADRVLRAYRELILATVRTNYAAPQALTADRPQLAFKIDAQCVGVLPEPRPASEIFVYSPQMEGVHMRLGPVARGGIRWSDRPDDYRTEVLGLVKAQAVKNAVIVPVGAKGVFVVKQRVDDRGIGGYRQFISGLLDVTDDYETPGVVSHPAGVVCYDGDDPYLVVAADKGTASFSDTANEIAVRRGYWLGDAFASGGSVGYDHKSMGITARGAWVSAAEHLRALDIEVDRQDFTVAGIGDMSGDVFGNGMLLSRHINLVAAFDHRHVFVDPTPDRAASYAERRRLFELPRSSWDDYDRSVISAGGGVWPRSAKRIRLTVSIRTALGIADSVDEVTPAQLISHILCAPVDLLFNGGIGTYIKATHEQHIDIGDKANDAVRVNASAVRAKAIVEGGNLGVSSRGRVEFARGGGMINTDALDNSAGVDCSDHEVNIKVLLDGSDDAQVRSAAERREILAAMTDEVAELVLANNRAHNHLLTDSVHNAADTVDVHARIVADLEQRRGLRRHREALPRHEEFVELAKSGAGLTRPQLATVMAQVKLDLKAQLSDDPVFDGRIFSRAVESYFPVALQGMSIEQHPLRRELAITETVNHILATGGITYPFRLMDTTGGQVGDVVRAHAVVWNVFGLDALWREIYAAELHPDITSGLVIEARRLLDRASRWFLSNRPQPLAVEAEMSRFGETLRELIPAVGEMLRGAEYDAAHRVSQSFLSQGVPPAVAQRVSEALYAYSLLDIVEAADAQGEDPRCLAEVYFELSNRLGFDTLFYAVSALPAHDRWDARARLALREDLYRSLRLLAVDALRYREDGDDSAAGTVQLWEELNRGRLQTVRRTMSELFAEDIASVASLTVAAGQIRRLTAAR